MEKKNGTTKKSRIIEVLLFLLIIGSMIFAYKTYNEISSLKKDIESFNNEINNKQENIKLLNDDISSLKNQYDTLVNIDNEIIKAKEDYFNEIASLEKKIMNDESDLKIAYLTFDDGPYRMSSYFLDILDEYDIPATFFYLMKAKENGYDDDYAEVCDKVYRRVIDSGHTLANHTASHKLGEGGIYRSVDAFMADVKRNRDFIHEKYGYETDILRFPGGSFTVGIKPYIVEELVKMGYSYVDWNSSTGDGSGGTALPPEGFRDNVLNNTNGKKIIVVLMHDYSDNTLIALPEIIDGLAKQGYIFLPLFHDSMMCLES